MTTEIYEPSLKYNEFVSLVLEDKLYVNPFCKKYKARVISISLNTEDFPPQGLLYVFNNQLGGFSIEGIKNSLEDKISEER
ncbi:MAG: hypothetical protein Q8R47_02640 [Nanoarchaeota archaeon]|nr:hypothetical protein [Nanoarchaeota archaeon]